VTTDECIALSDDELVDRTYDFLCRVMELDDEVGEDLSTLVRELIECGLPAAARAELIRTYSTEIARDPEDTNDLLDGIEDIRRRQAARLLRDTLKSS
jgi:hypothetical protein